MNWFFKFILSHYVFIIATFNLIKLNVKKKNKKTKTKII
jgi:hypothetical protein